MYECVKRIHVNVCTLPHIHTYIQSKCSLAEHMKDNTRI
uniref:Uncharacterized protein n=1 Tax=Anguilla anguilla TaxID=7936 RepID=A0A0E9RF77_ANGAN